MEEALYDPKMAGCLSILLAAEVVLADMLHVNLLGFQELTDDHWASDKVIRNAAYHLLATTMRSCVFKFYYKSDHARTEVWRAIRLHGNEVDVNFMRVLELLNAFRYGIGNQSVFLL